MKIPIKQKIIKSILDLYLLPVKANAKLKRFVQEVVLMDTAAHLSKPIQFLQSRNLISSNPVIVDIGGANGDTTSYFLRKLPHCRVFTFEANPELASGIKKRFANEAVTVHSMALSDKEGNLAFHIADNSLSSSYKIISENKQFQTLKSIIVPSFPLDTIMFKENKIMEIDILKLDVQGAELDVLNGAKETIKKTKMIVVEQSVRSPYEGGSMYYEVDNYLRNAGFELLDIIITFRKDGLVLTEYDSIYIQNKINTLN